MPGVTPKYNWTYPALVTIAREEGVAALYKGFVPKVLRLAPGGGVLLLVVEFTLGVFRQGKPSRGLDGNNTDFFQRWALLISSHRCANLRHLIQWMFSDMRSSFRTEFVKRVRWSPDEHAVSPIIPISKTTHDLLTDACMFLDTSVLRKAHSIRTALPMYR